MVIAQGHVYWADLPEPTGSGPGFRRPVLVVQGDALNRSRLRTEVGKLSKRRLELILAGIDIVLGR